MEFKIKEIRKEKGISLYKLSKSTGININYLRKLENNEKSNPSLLIMYKIALVLNVKIEDLFFVDMEILRVKLYESIDKNGINSKKTMSISKLLDILINIKTNKFF